MCMFVCLSEYMAYVCGVHGGYRRVSDSLKLELLMTVIHPIWLLAT